jgi:hypothetical protein
MKKYIVAATAAAVLVVPAAASAGFTDSWDAADQVQRVALKRYGYKGLEANCRNVSSRSFTCTIYGMKGDCFYDGRANVRKETAYRYRVTKLSIGRDCF